MRRRGLLRKRHPRSQQRRIARPAVIRDEIPLQLRQTDSEPVGSLNRPLVGWQRTGPVELAEGDVVGSDEGFGAELVDDGPLGGLGGGVEED